jgi:hypothetical protein
MARFLSSISSRYDRRLAMVVSSEVAYGLMRMGSALAEPGGIVPSVFREMEPARAWLLED